MKNPKNSSKRIKTLGLHEWTEDELIINFYVTKFGMTNLTSYFNSIDDLSNHLKLKPNSFKLQECNFRMLMKCKERVLTDYSKTQELVFDLFNSEPMYKYFQIVKGILNLDNLIRHKEMNRKFSNILN